MTAKGHLGLWWELFERYTQPGQWVLDPMAGIGSSLIGALMGRNVVCVDLESHFVEPMKASWAKMRQQAMLGHTLGEVLILQGDARCLPLGRAETVITSPPWGDERDGAGIASPGHPDGERKGLAHWGYTRPSAVVTSPPYEGSITPDSDGIDWSKSADSDRSKNVSRVENGSGRARGYTRPVASVITSPPFMDSEPFQDKSFNLHGDGPVSVTQPSATSYSKRESDNIGNLRGEKYWEAMRQVYGECHRVLAPGGLMVLVVKGYTRDKEYVDLPQQTVDCCQALGFTFVERWERELWNLSFWRILQQRRDPAAFDPRLRYESVLVARKE